MIKIFNAPQIKEIDNCSIINQGIASIDLMERASLAVYELLLQRLDPKLPVFIFAGQGNNGGDALAISRMLLLNHYRLQVFLVDTDGRLSPDCAINRERLKPLVPVRIISEEKDIPPIPQNCSIIDGLFGSGLNRPVGGIHYKLIEKINKSGNPVYSIDMPSGLFVEDNSDNNRDAIVKAREVFTFQCPKLSLLLPDNNPYFDKITVVDIGLCEKCMDSQSSDYYYIQDEDISTLLSPRKLFSHKGNYGRAMIIAGSYGKMGAAILAARACLRAGVGLLTMHIPRTGIEVMQTAVPEAMTDADNSDTHISAIDLDTVERCSLGIGPGIGEEKATGDFLLSLFQRYRRPVVLDADALNLIAANESLMQNIPPKSILTPHPVEFERLAGNSFANAYERLQAARRFASDHDVYVVLKGAYTAIATPENTVYFNPTGNPGMATGGSGDALTGIITSLLAQKYTPMDAALIGVFLHGLAADLAIEGSSARSLLPSDIIDYIGKAYFLLEKQYNR